MKTKLKNAVLAVLRYAPLALCIVFMFIYLFLGKDLSVDDLLNFAPEKPLFAALFLIVLYAFKSLTVFFPLIILNILGGFLFDPLPALIINMIGMLVELTVPYWIGRLSGTDFADKLRQKHPKITAMVGDDSDNHFFVSFFLRVISCLPGDAVSMYFGAIRMPYLTCLVGSFLGTLPGLVATTLLGTSITDPSSPMFWISISLTVGLSVLSLVIYCFLGKRKNQRRQAMKNKWFRSLLRKRFWIALILVLQLALLTYTLISGGLASDIIRWSMTTVSIIVCLYIIARKDKGAYKLTWVFLILVFPLFGGLIYLLFNFQLSTRHFSKSTAKAEEKAKGFLALPGSAYQAANSKLSQNAPQIKYLQDLAGFPIYSDTETKYLTPGEEKHKALLEELRKAEKYIFLEYFIVQEGVMWDSILEVLKEKASAGVKVRLIYDDFGCFFLLPKDYPKQLEKYGIECVIFNKFKPFLTSIQNNRDHRKIVSIDGKVAFTGGINLADEYINAIEKHGHWKDASVMLRGNGAWSFTVMFLEMWEICTGVDEDYLQYYPWSSENQLSLSNGFVQPYADSPMDKENVGEHVYLQIINNAKKYVYINTPYLIVDDSMISALCLAAKSGVDVRIVTPHMGDKWFVHTTTRSYYRELIGAGVKIYEYSKGFIHSKTFVSDDSIATVGTTNLDFRSLYLHFECGVCMYGTSAVTEVRDDFVKTLEECEEITPKDCKNNPLKRAFQNIMRVIAPLM